MIRCLALLTLFGCGAAPRLVDTSSRARFAETAASLAREQTVYPVTVKGDRLEVDSGPGPNDIYEINLDNPWTYCEGHPDDCDEGTRRYLAQALGRLEAAKARR